MPLMSLLFYYHLTKWAWCQVNYCISLQKSAHEIARISYFIAIFVHGGLF